LATTGTLTSCSSLPEIVYPTFVNDARTQLH
jgi:hypothetical protein